MKTITMNKLGSIATLAMIAGRSMADLHHLFTSSITTPHLFALEFDDKANTLVNVANMSAHDGHPWISFSYDKSTVYAGERTGFASYSVMNNTALSFSNSVSLPTSCAGSTADSIGSPYVLAELKAPFTVFGASSASCGTVMSVDVAGNLQHVLQSFKFKEGSSIKGMALDPDNKFLFSADEHSNGIWTHSVTPQGTVTPITFTMSPGNNKGPQRLVTHPDGKYLYAIFGQSNTVGIFAINNGIGSDKNPLAYTGLSYSLLPRGATTSLYMADEVLLSADANVLYATTRYIEPPKEPIKPTPTQVPTKTPTQAPTSTRTKPQPTQTPDDDEEEDRRWRLDQKSKRATQPGYITAILLTALSEGENPLERRTVGAGFPIRPLFQLASTTSGGLSNSVSPAPWGNDFFALADSEVGLIEIWKLENLQNANYTGQLGEGATTQPKGGWIQQTWSPNGVLQIPQAQDPNKPVDAPQPAQSPWTWGPSNDPWQSGRGAGGSGKDEDKEEPKRGRPSETPRWGGGDYDSQEESGGRDFDDERKRRYPATAQANWKIQNEKTKSKIARATIYERQTPGQSPPVTARVVATWHAPIIPKQGRRFTEPEPQGETVVAPLKYTSQRKPWTGSKLKKRNEPPNPPGPALAPSNHDGDLEWDTASSPPPNQQGIVLTEAQERNAAAAGRSCCANALWFD